MKKITNSNDINFNEVDFNDIFIKAKENSVCSHAITWINEVLKDEKKIDREKFLLIEKIIYEAQSHLPSK